MKTAAVLLLIVISVTMLLSMSYADDVVTTSQWYADRIHCEGSFMTVEMSSGQKDNIKYESVTAYTELLWPIVATYKLDQESRLVVTDIEALKKVQKKSDQLEHQQYLKEKKAEAPHNAEIVKIFIDKLVEGNLLATGQPGKVMKNEDELDKVGTYGDLRHAFTSINSSEAWSAFLKSVKDRNGKYYLKEVDSSQFPYTISSSHYARVVEKAEKGDIDDIKVMFTEGGDIICFPAE